MAADCRQQESGGGSSLLALGLTAAAQKCLTSEAGFAGSGSDFNKNPTNMYVLSPEFHFSISGMFYLFPPVLCHKTGRICSLMGEI